MRRDIVLMIDHRGKVHAVNELFEDEKRSQYGWLLVARDADVYDERPIEPAQSNPQRVRKHQYWWYSS